MTDAAAADGEIRKLLHSIEDVQALTGLGKTSVFAGNRRPDFLRINRGG